MRTKQEILSVVFDRIWSQGETVLIPAVYHWEFRAHYSHPPKWEPGHSGVERVVKSIRSSFPDYKERIVDFLEDGQTRAAVRIEITGTHLGMLEDVQATGKRVWFEEIILYRFDGERVVEQWGVPDLLLMRQQLGLTG